MEPYVDKALSLLIDRQLDALIVTNNYNISYLSGFDEGGAVLLLIPGKTNLIITDSRFIQEAASIKGFISEITSQKIPGLLAAKFKEFKLKKVAFEAKSLSYSQYLLLKEVSSGIELVATYDLVEEIRAVKEVHELKKIEKAISIATSAFEVLLDELKPGMAEKEIAERLELLLKEKGAHKTAFDTIVASGNNTSRPHAKPTQRIWHRDELLLIDWGVNFEGYNCDLTRVIFSDRITTNKKRIYKILLDAQERAVASIKPGKKANEIDALVRNFLKDNKLDVYFLHSLGHGIGREVHEAPSLASNCDVQLKKNMVITLEPAVYLGHDMGERIEDMIVVTENGCKVISGHLRKQFYA